MKDLYWGTSFFFWYISNDILPHSEPNITQKMLQITFENLSIGRQVTTRNHCWDLMQRDISLWCSEDIQTFLNNSVIWLKFENNEGNFAGVSDLRSSVFIAAKAWNHALKARFFAQLGIHSFSSLSYDRSKAFSKASSPHSVIQGFLLQMRVSSPFLKVIQ